MNLGVAILYKTPTPEDPGPFSFLKPLDQKVWFSIVVASAMISVGFFVVARLSPNQDQPKVTFKDAIWFTAGALLQQGIEISPRSTASLWGSDIFDIREILSKDIIYGPCKKVIEK